jgi:DNA repair protein RecN (Recombination protein N)
MLKKLQIEQFVIIDKSVVELDGGLSILTGETGAGKSIILKAMDLSLGGDSNPESIRKGSEQSDIWATFAPPRNNPVWNQLIKSDFVDATNDDFTVHRVIKTDGSDKITLNGKPIDQETLKEIGDQLMEIHGQFANQSLLGPENQMNLLDLFGNYEPHFFENVATALNNVKKYAKELQEEKDFLARHKGRILRKIEEICRKFGEIEMKKGFVEEAKVEYQRLLTAKETSEAFQSMLGRLIASNGAVVALSGAKETLDRQENLEEEKMEALSKHLESAIRSTRGAVEEMNRMIPDYEIDWEPLNHYKKVLTVMKTIAAENKIEMNQLEAFWEATTTKLARVQAGQDRLKEIEDLLIQAKNDYRKHAHILTEKRIEAGKKMAAEITAEFPPLKLPKAEFEISVEEKPDAKWTPRGFNEVTFLARMNPGMPFSPISQTASGGELARMILALKVVIQRVQTTGTLVFDEVDTGIGGAAAAAVGERIAQLAEKTQVMAITHSPQVAARGDHHYHISKTQEGNTTISYIHELSMEDRIDEISRMLAGDALTDESRAAAQILMKEAAEAAEVRRNAPPPPPPAPEPVQEAQPSQDAPESAGQENPVIGNGLEEHGAYPVEHSGDEEQSDTPSEEDRARPEAVQ